MLLICNFINETRSEICKPLMQTIYVARSKGECVARDLRGLVCVCVCATNQALNLRKYIAFSWAWKIWSCIFVYSINSFNRSRPEWKLFKKSIVCGDFFFFFLWNKQVKFHWYLLRFRRNVSYHDDEFFSRTSRWTFCIRYSKN